MGLTEVADLVTTRPQVYSPKVGRKGGRVGHGAEPRIRKNRSRRYWLLALTLLATTLGADRASAEPVRPEASIVGEYPKDYFKFPTDWLPGGGVGTEQDLIFKCPPILGEPSEFSVQIQKRYAGAWPAASDFGPDERFEVKRYILTRDTCVAKQTVGIMVPGIYRWRAGIFSSEAGRRNSLDTNGFFRAGPWSYFGLVRPSYPRPKPDPNPGPAFRAYCGNVGLFYREVETYRVRCRSARKILGWMTCSNPLCDRLSYGKFRCRVEIRKGEPQGVCRHRERYVWWSY